VPVLRRRTPTGPALSSNLRRYFAGSIFSIAPAVSSVRT